MANIISIKGATDSRKRRGLLAAGQQQVREEMEVLETFQKSFLSKWKDLKDKPRQQEVMAVESQLRFRKSLAENREHLTNVGVAINNETGNNMFQAIRQAEKLAAIERDAEEVVTAYNELMQKYQERLKEDGKDTEAHRTLLEETKVACAELLKDKDAVILQLKKNIKSRKKELEIDWQKREGDIKLICKRIASLVENIDKTGREEINLISGTLEEEREEFIKGASFRLSIRSEEDHEERREASYDKLRESILERYSTFHQYKVNAFNKLHPVRLELSRELHQFQLCLWEAENHMMSNLGKLKYGHHLLDLQMKECRVSRSETLRSKISYFDRQLQLRKRLKQLSSHAGLDQVQEEVEKQEKKLKDRSHRAKFLHHANQKKYTDLFHQRREEVKALLDNIYEIDRCIYKDILKVAWEKPDLSFLEWETLSMTPEEQRLRKVLNSFLEGGSDSVQKGKPKTESPPQHGPMKSFVIKRPLNAQRLMHFVFDSLDFLVSTEAKDFARSQYPATIDFVIANCFFPAVGIESMDQMKLFLAHILDKSTEVSEYGDAILNYKDVLNAFENWQEFCNTKRRLQASVPTINLPDAGQEHIWNLCKNIFPKAKEIVWDQLFNLLTKYLSALDTKIKLERRTASKKKEVLELARVLGKRLIGDKSYTIASSYSTEESQADSSNLRSSEQSSTYLESDNFRDVKQYVTKSTDGCLLKR